MSGRYPPPLSVSTPLAVPCLTDTRLQATLILLMRLLFRPLSILITFVVLYLHYDQMLSGPPGVYTIVPYPGTLHCAEILM